MAKDNRIDIEINAKGGPSLKRTTKQIKKQKKSLDRLSSSGKRLDKQQARQYTRQKQGVIGTANSTKNFSKMQQSMDGGGGAGGLVRAYALLAANVFALSAAFGILSRAAQVDSLTASMKQLEVVSGKSILGISRQLQEAAGFGMDFAESMRATSLAMSAGFGGDQITQLAEVARNAAVSLGRNVPDALDRIFRGVIKVEPELLDEIGLFVRVNESSAKYASTIGKSASELTEFEKRQAFMNEALEQGTTKFAAFADVPTDAFTLLGTTFADMTQGIISFLNKGILPTVRYLSDNKLLFGTLFAVLGTALIRMAIPAMTQFTFATQKNAQAAADNLEKQKKNSKMMSNQVRISTDRYLAAEQQKQKAVLKTATTESQARKPVTLAVRGRKKSKNLEKVLQKELVIISRQQVVEQRILDLKTKQGFKDRMSNADAREELRLLEAESLQNAALLKIDEKRSLLTSKALIKKGKLLHTQNINALTASWKANTLALFVNETQTQGAAAAFEIMNQEVMRLTVGVTLAGGSFTLFQRILFRLKGTVAILGVSFQALWSKIMGPLTIILMLLPAFQALNKAMGVGSKLAEELTDANRDSAEALERLAPRIAHVQKEFKKLTDEGEMNWEAYNKGQETLANTILTTITAIEAQENAFEAYMDSASGWAIFWGETFPAAFGGGTEEALRRSRKALISELQIMQDELPQEMQDLFKELDKISEGTKVMGRGSAKGKYTIVIDEDEQKRVRQEIIAMEKARTIAYKNVRSAIDGARDSARAFTDSLIVKTDVDKPLSTFTQIRASLEDIALTEKERANLSREVSGNSAFQALMTQEQRDQMRLLTASYEEQLKFSGKDSDARFMLLHTGKTYMGVLKEIEDGYFRQQNILIRNKAELKTMAIIQGVIKKVAKESTDVIEMQMVAERRMAKLNIRQVEIKAQNAAKGTVLTRQQLEQLILAEDINAEFEGRGKIISKAVADGLDQKAVQAAISAIIEEQNVRLTERITEATRDLRITKEIAELELRRLNIQETLNQAVLTGIKLQQKIEAFSKRGTTKLTAAEEVKAIIKAEEVRLKTAKERARLELVIITAKYAILLEQWKLLAEDKKLTQQKLAIAKIETLSRQIAELPLGSPERSVLREDLLSAAESVAHWSQENLGMKEIFGIDAEAFQGAIAAERAIIEQEFDNAANSYIVSLMDQLEKMKTKNASKIIPLAQGVAFKGLEQMAGTRGIRDEALTKGATAAATIKAAEAEIRLIAMRAEAHEQLEGDNALYLTLKDNIEKATAAKEAFADTAAAAEIQLFTDAIRNFGQAVATLGEEGMLAATMADFSAGLIETFSAIDFQLTSTADKLAIVAGVIQGIGAIMAAASAANIANIDKEIKAEQKRDGKSKQSLARIKAMEAKKDKMARKAFEMNKKIQIASAIMSTAAAIVGILAAESPKVGIASVPLAAMVGALGAAQVAIIASMQYQGGGSEGEIKTPASISVGERTNRVDVSKQASAGELAYLRGEKGIGTTATSFRPMGGAAGLRRGYQTGGSILVGEQGPETITPLSPMQVWPAGQGAKSQINAHFTIHAIDAAGVEEVLLGQQGNIISMIRSAANDYGEDFLEVIDTESYGDFSGTPQSGGGVDY